MKKALLYNTTIMKTELLQNTSNINNDLICDTLDYRGHHIEFHNDPVVSQVYTYWQGKLLNFGINNINYIQDIINIIDEYEDTLLILEPLVKLSLFRNAGYIDVRLTYKGRTIKVYLLTNFEDPEAAVKTNTDRILDQITADAKSFLIQNRENLEKIEKI